MAIGSKHHTRRRVAALAATLVVAGWGSVAGAAPARAVSDGTAVPDGSYGFVARLDMAGARACTGALVSPMWVISAKSCFAGGSEPVVAGPPPLPTTVSFGRAGRSAAPGGRVVSVASIVVHPDRDIALAKLSLQITDIAPIAVSATAPAADDLLQAAGFGRTSSDWVPDQPHSAPVTVTGVTTGSFAWTGTATACQGDAGGPVFRDSADRPELVGLDIASAQGGCYGEPDGEHGATAVRVDDAKAWIAANTPGLTGTFAAPFASGSGIGGFSLADPRDQVVAFDYDHSGKQDHLLLYRPGQGAVYILKHNPDNTYTRVYATADAGIGGYDLRNTADRIVPFDYDHTGKLDHLVLYRPGTGAAYILKHGAGNTFTPVYRTNTAGIGGYNLADPDDRIVAFDYDHTGKQDHLLLYRPGSRTAWVLRHNPDNSFTRVYSSNTAGIGGYDLGSTADRIVPFDYDHTGKLDHLVAYRPGSKTIYILKHEANNTFSRVYSTNTAGIGGFSLADPRDQVVAFDYDHSGKQDHLLLYRPGQGAVYILKHNPDNTYTRVYATADAGIGGYDLRNTADRIVPFDYDHSGAQDHLVLYRPQNRNIWIVGRQHAQPTTASPGAPGGGQLPDGSGGPIVEDYTHPGAAAILAQLGLKLFKGDGHIIFESARPFTESQCPAGLIQVEKILNEDPFGVYYCFRTIGPKGVLTLEVPGTFGVRGGSEEIVVTAKLPDGTVLSPYEVGPNESVPIEPGDGSELPQAILVEIRNR